MFTRQLCQSFLKVDYLQAFDFPNIRRKRLNLNRQENKEQNSVKFVSVSTEPCNSQAEAIKV